MIKELPGILGIGLCIKDFLKAIVQNIKLQRIIIYI